MSGIRGLARFFSLFLFVTGIVSLGIAAQDGSQQKKAQENTSPKNGSQANAKIRADVNLVLVDVCVTEGGVPVHDLPASRFHLLENGKEQKITSFEEVSSGNQAAPAAKSMGAAAGPPLPPHVYTDVPPYPATGQLNILLLDGLNTPLADQMQMRSQVTDFIRSSAPGTRMAIFTLTSRLRLIQGFTGDPSFLSKAISQGSSAQASSLLDTTAIKTLGDAAADQASYGLSPDAVGAMQQFQADQAAYQVDTRIRLTLDAMQQLARYLGSIPGRKNLIWFSGSFPIRLDPDDSQISPFQAARNYAEDMRDTSLRLAAARVAVYPVDARGLTTLSSSDASYSGSAPSPSAGALLKSRRTGMRSAAGGMPQLAKDNQGFMTSAADELASMQQIAEDSGGQVFFNSNGLKEAIKHALASGANYYTLAYRPENGSGTSGDFRRLTVQVTGGTYSLAYRRGYYADDLHSVTHSAATGIIASATLHGAPTASEVRFKVRILASAEGGIPDTGVEKPKIAGEVALRGKAVRYRMDFAIDPASISLVTEADGFRRARVELTAIAYDQAGQRLNYCDNGFDMKVPPRQLEAAFQTGLPMHAELDLPPGQVDLRIAVRDLSTNHVGSTEVPLVVSLP